MRTHATEDIVWVAIDKAWKKVCNIYPYSEPSVPQRDALKFYLVTIKRVLTYVQSRF